MGRVLAYVRLSNLMNRPRAPERLPWHWLLPLLFLLVGLVYLYAAPNFEASDSAQHIGVIKWIAERGELPLQSPDHAQLFGQEASQPPLYYLLMAAVWQAFDTADFDARYLPSPFTAIGAPARWGNRNLLIYRQVYPPDLSGSSLALYAIRFLSLCMGAGAVAVVYQAARTALPGQAGAALLAASLTAFNPQFLFISASVSNDALINLLAALLAWRMLIMLRDGFETRRSLLLALLIALAALTKLSGLTVAVVVGLAALWTLAQRRDFRGFALLAGATLALTLLDRRALVSAQSLALWRALRHRDHAGLLRPARDQPLALDSRRIPGLARQLLGGLRRIQHPRARGLLSDHGSAQPGRRGRFADHSGAGSS